MAHEMNTFNSYQNLNTSQVVYLGDGNTHQICGYGDISIMLNTRGRKQIPKELHVFGLMVCCHIVLFLGVSVFELQPW
jgi:hypothetical protein